MNPSRHPSNKFSGTDWQTLGALEVRPGSDAESAIRAWLTESLKPLDLHDDLLHRIGRSASEAARRALQFNEAVAGNQHIHLLALAPRHQRLNGQTWGFFRLEKLAGRLAHQSGPVHSIEFYLYAEVQAASDQGTTAQSEVPE
jgi:hypothetical protein